VRGGGGGGIVRSHSSVRNMRIMRNASEIKQMSL
jgi:hypothetical protein